MGGNALRSYLTLRLFPKRSPYARYEVRRIEIYYSNQRVKVEHVFVNHVLLDLPTPSTTPAASPTSHAD